LSLDSHEVPPGSDHSKSHAKRLKQGVRTHVLLVCAMALVIASVTTLSLLLLRQGLRAQITKNLSEDLTHSVITFQNLQAERLAALERENALLADLPTLKALMTSGDDLTIQDGAVEFWQLSGNDLFALATSSGRIVAAYTKSAPATGVLRDNIGALIASRDKHYFIDGDSLYACAVRPLYFGSNEEGTLLGYVVSGISIERTVKQISQPTGVEATFISQGRAVASTLLLPAQQDLVTLPSLPATSSDGSANVTVDGTPYIAATEDLSSSATSPLQLVVLKSLRPAELWIRRIDRVVLTAGILALILGTLLMVVLSLFVTRPLESLSRSVRAFGVGDGDYKVPLNGTREVRQLSAAFVRMRDEIRQVNVKLLETERLATIGRMASSVSHDLRHYLAAIYANSEFLALDQMSAKERADIFADIRTAVHGTTDMIESLLIFSRTGSSIRRVPELMATLLERATALTRQHPDAEGITLITRYGDPTETAAIVDGKQIERAIFNLALNACQTRRSPGTDPQVVLTLEALAQVVTIRVEDNGVGIPENIRTSLFEPFVSEGKQKGTGLGLTLAARVAAEHGGDVKLVSSRAGETVFQMTVARGLSDHPHHGINPDHQDQVDTHEDAHI
jgi:signal transduction histidine kinase